MEVVEAFGDIRYLTMGLVRHAVQWKGNARETVCLYLDALQCTLEDLRPASNPKQVRGGRLLRQGGRRYLDGPSVSTSQLPGEMSVRFMSVRGPGDAGLTTYLPDLLRIRSGVHPDASDPYF